MSLTVGEVLENAKFNRKNAVMQFQINLAKEQEKNYRKAKELGASDEDDWYEWAEKIKQSENKIG